MTQDEMILAISEGLHNLNDNYPQENKERAWRALGMLKNQMDFQEDPIFTIFHHEGGYTTQERR